MTHPYYRLPYNHFPVFNVAILMKPVMLNHKIHFKVSYYPVYFFSSRIQSVVIGIIAKAAFRNKHENIILKYIKQRRTEKAETPVITSFRSLNEPFIELPCCLLRK